MHHKHSSLFLSILFTLTLLGINGCSFKSRPEIAQDIAIKGQLQPVVFHTSHFEIQGYQRFKETSPHLTIYLEGDGAAWKNKFTLASDPTPRSPIALSLAGQDPAPNILYLARPCQYKTTASCTPKYWSSHRYSPEITQAINDAINEATQTHQIQTITLIGYSGGGVLATLLAAKRHDVSLIITLAANLEIDYWTKLHGVTPLWGSSNPCNYGETLQHIPQIHIIGEDDKTVPMPVIQAYLDCLPSTKNVKSMIIPQTKHHSNWSEIWPAILSQIRPSTINPNSL